MLIPERQSRLEELIAQRGMCDLETLASELRVSSSTVRRDVDALAKRGLVKRTHGGVIWVGSDTESSSRPYAFDQRMDFRADAKRAIARAARALVKPGLMAMQGADAASPSWRARLTVPLRKKHDRTEYLRARLDCGDDAVLRATPVERQGSGMMAGVAEADALIVIPEQTHALGEGDVVDVMLLPDAC